VGRGPWAVGPWAVGGGRVWAVGLAKRLYFKTTYAPVKLLKCIRRVSFKNTEPDTEDTHERREKKKHIYYHKIVEE
jgi:hypothetical protein